MVRGEKTGAVRRRLIVIGGHTRSIGKTQLVCDLLAAFPQQDWIAGKITQYGHGVCARNGENCGCAPAEHSAAFDWESGASAGTDSARFLVAGARRSFWLRTKMGFLAEGLPLLRQELAGVQGFGRGEPPPVIVESNSLLQFLKPTLYLAVIDPQKDDFKTSARAALDRADLLVFRSSRSRFGEACPDLFELPSQLLEAKPSVTHAEQEPLPAALLALVRHALEAPPSVVI